MNEKKYFIDDRVIIPDDIKKMSKEELQKEIDKFEKEAKKKQKRSVKPHSKFCKNRPQQ